MTIREVSVANFRSHELFSLELHPSVTVVLGHNGAGKTTLLEALYLLLQGSSFRSRDRDVIRHDHPTGTAKLTDDSGGERRITLTLSPDDKLSKQFVVADRTTARLSSAHKSPVVLFDPDQLRLLTSSPARRREFIDGIIARLSPTYSAVLSRYNRTLTQRNELLKQSEQLSYSAWESHLFAWDVKLAELGASIIKARRQFLEQSTDRLSALYRSLSGTDQIITTSYISTLSDSSQQVLLNHLQHAHKADAFRGFTGVGPHRDDITVFINGRPAADTASRGELRTIMLAFKLLEVELQEHHTGTKPLILLDDVFSELDSERETKLMQALAEHQTIITATDLRDTLTRTASVVTLE